MFLFFVLWHESHDIANITVAVRVLMSTPGELWSSPGVLVIVSEYINRWSNIMQRLS
jgi:hypothetical protein